MEIKWIAIAFAVVLSSMLLSKAYVDGTREDVRIECFKMNTELVKQNRPIVNCNY